VQVQSESRVQAAEEEAAHYKKLYRDLLEKYRKLELGILGQKRERFVPNAQQLSLAIITEMLGGAQTKPVAPAHVEAHTRQKPTGRKPLPENLPRIDIEVLPEEVEALGKDAFVQIGEDVCETVERRPASVVVVRVHKPKFVPKDKTQTDSVVVQAPSPELPIERGLAGPGFLADTIVKRWQDHLPLHRQERIFAREGWALSRSTICGWHQALKGLVAPLIEAMWEDALLAPYLCTDATGVLVQELDKCRNAHFFVVAAPDKHVLFGYTPKHNGKAVDALIGGYRGYLVADAHSVYNHLYRSGEVIEVGCWAHARRYFFKALETEPALAQEALTLIQGLFLIERAHQAESLEARKAAREHESRPLLEAFFAWCADKAGSVLDETPIKKAIGYAQNQRAPLSRFVDDARLPLHNNFSERALRREALGRKNWLFVGSDDGGETNAVFVSLLASCQLHDIEPFAYLRDLLCLLPSWKKSDVLRLAPAYWKETLKDDETQKRLAANVFRQVSLGLRDPHPENA
jgi:transposase